MNNALNTPSTSSVQDNSLGLSEMVASRSAMYNSFQLGDQDTGGGHLGVLWASAGIL